MAAATVWPQAGVGFGGRKKVLLKLFGGGRDADAIPGMSAGTERGVDCVSIQW